MEDGVFGWTGWEDREDAACIAQTAASVMPSAAKLIPSVAMLVASSMI